jgi:hypothetical protein
MESMELLMDDGENGTGGVASLKLDGKWMCKKVVLGSLFVCLQGMIKN